MLGIVNFESSRLQKLSSRSDKEVVQTDEIVPDLNHSGKIVNRLVYENLYLNHVVPDMSELAKHMVSTPRTPTYV